MFHQSLATHHSALTTVLFARETWSELKKNSVRPDVEKKSCSQKLSYPSSKM